MQGVAVVFGVSRLFSSLVNSGTLSAMDTSVEQSPATVEQPYSRPRRVWVALLLSLVAAGLGQLYNGQWRKGLLFFGLELAVGLALFVGLRSFTGMAVNLTALLGLNLYAVTDAILVARRSREFRPGPWNRGWIYLLTAVISLSAGNGLNLAIKTRLEAYKVPSGSMIPTLLVGDHFMVEKLSPDTEVRRGDVIVFLERNSGKRFVKRVVGLPGETVSMTHRQVLVDGLKLDEPYVNRADGSSLESRDFLAPVRLGPDRYFVMGDNRDHSYDSRWIGPVKQADIVGRALYLYLPGAPEQGSRFARLGRSVR